MKKEIKNIFLDSKELLTQIIEDDFLLDKLQKVTEICINTLQNKNKILIAGNGGSAADAQHFAAELVGRFYKNRKALPAIALTTDTSILTAVGNDYGFEEIFNKQIEALGESKDVYFTISSSGNSPNLTKSVLTAKTKGMITISLTGKDGGQLKSLTDFNININNQDTPRIQEIHATIIHIISYLIEKTLFS